MHDHGRAPSPRGPDASDADETLLYSSLDAALSAASGGAWRLESVAWGESGVLSLTVRLPMPVSMAVRKAPAGPHTIRWSAGLSLTAVEPGLEHRAGAELVARAGQAILDTVRPWFGLPPAAARAPSPLPPPMPSPVLRPRPEPVFAAPTDDEAPVLDHPAALALARAVEEATRPAWTLLRVEDLPGPGLLLRCRTPFGRVELTLRAAPPGPRTLRWRDGLDLASSMEQLERLVPGPEVERLAQAVHDAGRAILRPPAPEPPPARPVAPIAPEPTAPVARAPVSAPAVGARGRGGRRTRDERRRLAATVAGGLLLGLLPAWLLGGSAAALGAAGAVGVGLGLAVGLRVRDRLFGVDRWRDFEDPFDPARREQASTQRVLAALQLARDARVLDVGAGTGFFSFLIASRLGNEGRVYALESDAGRARAIQEVADEYGIGTVEVLRLSAFQTETLDLAVDAVLVVNVYLFDRAQPERTTALLRNLGSLLGPGGRLVIHSDFVFNRAPGRLLGHVYPAAHDDEDGEGVARLAPPGLVLASLAPVTDVPSTYDNARPGYLLVLRREA